MSAAPRTSWGATLRAVLRESRAARARLLFLVACLAIGVAAVVGVSALVGAMEAGLREESRDLLAADLKVSARRPLPEELDAVLAEIPHERADVRTMSAMASRAGVDGADSRLVELKVVDAGYPFYGELVLEPQLATGELGEDRVFCGPELLSGLGLEVGDDLHLGGARFTIAAAVVDEPDRLDFAMTLGPRVFMSPEGLGRTHLFDSKSRVRYAALLKLDEVYDKEGLRDLVRHLKRELDDPEYLSFRAHTDAQPQLRRSLGRVEDYLGLVALLSLLLGGIGVSQIVRAWLAGRTQGVAVMRCMGFRAREVAVQYLGHVLLLALAGCIVGGAVGALLPWGVRQWAPDLFQGSAAHLWQPGAVLQGIVLGLFVAAFFSLPPLTAVWRVPPAAVLRAEAVPLRAPWLVRLGAPLAVFLGVLISAYVQGGTWLVAASFSGGLLVLTGLLYGAARLVNVLSARIPRGRLGPYFEHGLAAMARPGSGTTGAVVALGLGVLVVVAMALVEGRLGEALRTALPEDAPSVFLVDVQPDQWEGVREVMVAQGARSLDAVPVVMARLREVDGRKATELARERRRDGQRGTWVFTREQRLTWLEELPPDNEIVAGELWSDPDRPEVSIEEEFAEDLGVGVGATLVLDVQGIPVELAVTSVRKVEWRSFGINFFLVVEPGVLDGAPHFRIAAARVDPAEAEYRLQNEVAERYPNVTLIRVRPVLEKVAAVLERLAFGVRALGLFTILTGLVILGGAVGVTATRRKREAALLKTLGITRSGVTRLFAVEYALGGLVAGTLGAAGALVLSWAFLEHLVELDADLPLVAIPVAALGAALLSTLCGLAASLRALTARPLETLRG